MADEATASHFPLEWPQGYPRTQRRKGSRFQTSLADARDGLLKELSRMSAKSVVISSNIETYVRSGQRIPYAGQANPSDPGVAVYFQWNGEAYSLACDRWKKAEGNMQALRKTVAAMRGLDRWGVSDMLRRTFRGFKALPEKGAGEAWWNVLEVSEHAGREEITAAYRAKAQKAHPDKPGGSEEAWHELREARKQALEAI